MIFTPADLPVGQNDAKHLPDLLCAFGPDRRRRSAGEIGISLRIPEPLRYRSVRLVAVISDIVGIELALTCIPPILAVLRWWSHNRPKRMARSAATVTAGFAATDGDAALGRAAGAAMVANGGLDRVYRIHEVRALAAWTAVASRARGSARDEANSDR